jgi:hypothetical protein
MYDGGEFYSIMKAAEELLKLPDKRIKVAFLPYKTDPNNLSDQELDYAYSTARVVTALSLAGLKYNYHVNCKRDWNAFLRQRSQDRS